MSFLSVRLLHEALLDGGRDPWRWDFAAPRSVSDGQARDSLLRRLSAFGSSVGVRTRGDRVERRPLGIVNGREGKVDRARRVSLGAFRLRDGVIRLELCFGEGLVSVEVGGLFLDLALQRGPVLSCRLFRRR